jgi:integrase
VQVLEGIDPLKAREDAAIAKQLEASKHKTVAECAMEWWHSRKKGWRSEETATNRRRQIEMYIIPKIGSVPVHRVDVALAEETLKPIWGTATSGFVQQIGLGIMNYAKGKGYRTGDNPFDMNVKKGAPLADLLVPLKKIHKVTHHASLPHKEVGAFMAELRAQDVNDSGQGADPITPYLMRFKILTAIRKSEMLYARWNEVDFEDGTWTIPPARKHVAGVRNSQRGRKTGHHDDQVHVVFLSRQAVDILKTMRRFQIEDGIYCENENKDGFCFVHRRTKRIGTGPRGSMTGKPYSEHAMRAFLHRPTAMNRPDITMHGFRSTFRRWAIEHGHNENACELALDHVVGTSVRNDYVRGSEDTKARIHVMDAWAAYCDRVGPLWADVIDMSSRRKEIAQSA